MGRSAEARALFKHIRHKDVDLKIKESRDDLLLIMQSEHRQLNLKIDNLESRIDTRIDALESRIDTRIDALESRMDGLDKRMDGFDKRMDRMENRMDDQTSQIVSMKKWAIGLCLAVILAIIALAAPIYFTIIMQIN